MPSSACTAPHRSSHSFPTRRSSDLRGAGSSSQRVGRSASHTVRGGMGPLRPAVASDRRLSNRTRHRPTGNTRTPAPGLQHRRRLQPRSEEHTSELQSLTNLVCRLLLVLRHTDPHTLSLHDALPISAALVVHPNGSDAARATPSAVEWVRSGRPLLAIDAYQTGRAIGPRETPGRQHLVFNTGDASNRDRKSTRLNSSH